jgi:hypothetical protein
MSVDFVRSMVMEDYLKRYLSERETPAKPQARCYADGRVKEL